MVDLTVLPGFIAVILLFLIPPGPDMAYMLAVGLQGGRRPALKAILGIGTGMAVYAAAVVAGVGHIAESHPALFDALKLAGAIYLSWLAFVTWRHAHDAVEGPDEIREKSWYTRGLVVSATNPKIMLFFLAVLPQFIGGAETVSLQLAMLGAVNVATEMVLYGSLGMFAGAFNSRFAKRRNSQALLNYVASAVYAGLAAVVVAEVVVSSGA